MLQWQPLWLHSAVTWLLQQEHIKYLGDYPVDQRDEKNFGSKII